MYWPHCALLLVAALTCATLYSLELPSLTLLELHCLCLLCALLVSSSMWEILPKDTLLLHVFLQCKIMSCVDLPNHLTPPRNVSLPLPSSWHGGVLTAVGIVYEGAGVAVQGMCDRHLSPLLVWGTSVNGSALHCVCVG